MRCLRKCERAGGYSTLIRLYVLFGLSLLSALDGGDGGVGSSLGPLVDDHLIYCNITHKRTINEGGGDAGGETKVREKVRPVVCRAHERPALGILLWTLAVWNDRSSDQSEVGQSGRGLLERMYGISVKRNGHEIVAASNRHWPIEVSRCQINSDRIARRVIKRRNYSFFFFFLCKGNRNTTTQLSTNVLSMVKQ